MGMNGSLLWFYTISNYDPEYSYTILITLFLNIFTKQYFSQKHTIISNPESKNLKNCSLQKCISGYCYTLKLLPQKMYFKTLVHIKTASSKNAFQNIGA